VAMVRSLGDDERAARAGRSLGRSRVLPTLPHPRPLAALALHNLVAFLEQALAFTVFACLFFLYVRAFFIGHRVLQIKQLQASTFDMYAAACQRSRNALAVLAGFIPRLPEGLPDIAVIGVPASGRHPIGKVFWGPVRYHGIRYWRHRLI
jgi:hypothetical protein